ncbi:MAG: helix-turn-helix transcriptional regulator [Synergistaceae bacterium]|nr:helix-turn-helix transcriptional regulator [Synergistaceae bacterium]
MTRLRELRQERGLTLSDLCRARKLSVSELSYVERRKHVASRRLKEALLKFYHASSDELFDNEGLARHAMKG